MSISSELSTSGVDEAITSPSPSPRPSIGLHHCLTRLKSHGGEATESDKMSFPRLTGTLPHSGTFPICMHFRPANSGESLLQLSSFHLTNKLNKATDS